VRVGSIELDPVVDAWGELGELGELYPETPAEAWAPYRGLYADLFTGTRWRLPCTCYLVRSADRVVLVDTGVGPPGSWGWRAEREGGLLPGLAALGVEPHDVDVVFLTHIHIDHVGWNADADGLPVFPNARYLLHPDGLALARDRADVPHIRRCLRSIVDAGLADEVEAGAEVAPGVTAIDLPGHLPGHLGLRLAQEAVLIADAAVHPALLDQPEWVYVSDSEPATAAETRRALLLELEGRDMPVVCGHYPAGGIGRLERRDGRNVWQALHGPGGTTERDSV
jgi:glyoxylase-like metal-dependent hydrolase (beta-lactamase superfamily II)